MARRHGIRFPTRRGRAGGPLADVLEARQLLSVSLRSLAPFSPTGKASAETVAVAASLPAGWTSVDVGSPALAGSASGSGSAFTVAGSGSTVAGTADQFQYVYQTLASDGTIVARVVTQQDTAANAIAGVMIRQSLTAGSAEATVDVTPADGIEFASRSTTGVTVASHYTTASTATEWVKLVRTGSAFGGYYSADGVTWTAAFAALVPMTNPVYVGLDVSSGTSTALSTATFDNVSVTAAPATTSPTASANPVTGTTTTLSVPGTAATGTTYTWKATALPAGAAAPTFSANGTTAAQSTTATFTHAGAYTFGVTITTAAGVTTTGTEKVTVNATPTAVSVTPATATVPAGQTAQLTGSAKDQFGQAITAAPPFTWSLASGGVGTVSSTGAYTAPAAGGGSATVRATAGTASGTAAMTAKLPPFTVFDGLNYTGAPQAAQYGLHQETVIYDGYIWSPGDTTLLYNQTDGEYATLPDETTYKNSVLSHIALQGGNLTTPSAIVLDIERLTLSQGTAAQVEQNFNVLITLAQWTEEVAPLDTVGFYTTNGNGILPTPWGSAYQAEAAQLADTVDAFFPSMYLSTSNASHTTWASEETGLVAQAKSLAPGKPVDFYLWPQYDETGNAYMPASEWTYELTESQAAGGSGIVMWSGSSTAFDATEPYWAATLSFVAGIDNPVIGSVAVSAASVTAGTPVTVSADVVTDAGAAITSVSFFLETNGTAGLQVGSDPLLGSGTQSGTDWSISVSTAGLAAGTYTVYAVAADAAGVQTPAGLTSAAATVVVSA